MPPRAGARRASPRPPHGDARRRCGGMRRRRQAVAHRFAWIESRLPWARADGHRRCRQDVALGGAGRCEATGPRAGSPLGLGTMFAVGSMRWSDCRHEGHRQRGTSARRERHGRERDDALKSHLGDVHEPFPSTTAVAGDHGLHIRAPGRRLTDDAGVAGRTRPMWLYPTWPKYKGSGDVDAASSFVSVSS